MVKKAQTFVGGEYFTYISLPESDVNLLRNKAAMVIGINGCLRYDTMNYMPPTTHICSESDMAKLKFQHFVRFTDEAGALMYKVTLDFATKTKGVRS